MRIKILGCGGALNSGMPYNAFLADETLLCETPPDIMPSLAREGSDPLKISTIYLSHFHADHCFGLPFFLLDRFFRYRGADSPGAALTIAGPAGIEERSLTLLELGWGRHHPCFEWTRRHCRFVTINAGARHPLLASYRTSYHAMEHFDETYGFVLEKGNETLFAYVADTVWGESVAALLAKKPKYALIDLNGEPDDPMQLHLSEQDLADKALQITGDATEYYGTHLKRYKSSGLPRLTYVKEGMMIDIKGL